MQGVDGLNYGGSMISKGFLFFLAIWLLGRVSEEGCSKMSAFLSVLSIFVFVEGSGLIR